jgi:hypothetical protein
MTRQEMLAPALKSIAEFWTPFIHMQDQVDGALHIAALLVLPELGTWEKAYAWCAERACVKYEAKGDCC